MSNHKYFFNFLILGLLLSGTELAIAQQNTNSQTEKTKPCTIVCLNPDRSKQPKMTFAGGTRGGLLCGQNLQNDPKLKLHILVPSAYEPETPNGNPENGWAGLTLAERPVFWVYLPKTSAKQVTLVIREENSGEEHSKTDFPITGKLGIFGLKLSDKSPPLKVGKAYTWTVNLMCDKKQIPGPDDMWFTSGVYRLDSRKIPRPPSNSTALTLASWYAEHGIWYDALDTLAEARRAEPNKQNLVDIWTDFLNSAGLEAISKEPLSVMITPVQ